jgi:hypothetical protein
MHVLLPTEPRVCDGPFSVGSHLYELAAPYSVNLLPYLLSGRYGVSIPVALVCLRVLLQTEGGNRCSHHAVWLSNCRENEGWL